MSQETLINVQRPKGMPVATLQNVPVRIVEKTVIVALGDGGAVPYSSLTLFSLAGTPALEIGDYLVATDGSVYRASGTPIIYDDSYLKMQVTRYSEVLP